MRENIIVPLTDEEYIHLKEQVSLIGNYLPENMTVYVWDTFNRLRGENENRPCNCGSAGAHWGRAVKYLRDYIKEKESV
tara:strand:- start:428 stop:664 length:237 start_codon:yes stop_codon:yes gene_type:complete